MERGIKIGHGTLLSTGNGRAKRRWIKMLVNDSRPIKLSANEELVCSLVYPGNSHDYVVEMIPISQWTYRSLPLK